MTVLEHNLDVANATADSQYPDEFGVVNVGPFIADDAAPIIVFVTDREILVDSVTYRMSAISTANLDIQVSWVASGAAPSSVNLAANVATVAFNTSNTDGAGADAVANTVYHRKAIKGSNVIPASSLVCIRWGANSVIPAGVSNFVATIRYRTRHA